MKVIVYLSLVGAFLIISGCGFSGSGDGIRGNLGTREVFPASYEVQGVDLNGRPCKVLVRAKTNEERCENLMSRSRNNSCALPERRALFERHCSTFRVRVFVEIP